MYGDLGKTITTHEAIDIMAGKAIPVGVYKAGEQMPNLTLFEAEATWPQFGPTTTVTAPTQIKDLLTEFMNFHWAACQIIRKVGE